MNKNEPVARRCIALTGGHFSPAYALVEALEKQNRPIIFFGRKHAFAEGQSPTIEHQLIGSHPLVTFVSIPGARVNFRILQHFLLSFFTVLRSLIKYKPEYIISFGGYLAVPVCIAGWILHIPVYLHEQTIAPGKANQFLTNFSQKVYIAFPEAAISFPHSKTRLIGNPYHSDFFSPVTPQWFTRDNNRPLLLIMGGSSGAHSVNELFIKDIDVLIQKYQIVHQIGSSKYRDYEQLTQYRSPHYYPVRQLTPQEIAYFMKNSDMAVTRSGANTFFLLVYYELPCVLIPLSIAPNDEQRKHAQCIAHEGAGVIMEERGSAYSLSSVCESIYSSRGAKRQAYQKLASYKALIISGQNLLSAIQS